MKTVGQQLEEARLARKWTPELASRETKIKVERLLDLEADNFSNFSSPAYARGFVRTYARALHLDEYKVLRQLDNKLPEDSVVLSTDSGVAYLPEATEVKQKPRTKGFGGDLLQMFGVIAGLVILWVLVEAYRASSLVDTKDGHGGGGTTSFNSESQETAPSVTPPLDSGQPVKALPVEPESVSNQKSGPQAAIPVAPEVSAPPAVIPIAPIAGAATPAPVPVAVHPSPVVIEKAQPVGDESSIPIAPAAPASPASPESHPAQPVSSKVVMPALPLNATPAPGGTEPPIPVAPAAVPVDIPVAPAANSTPASAPLGTKPLTLKLYPRGDSFVNVTETDDPSGTPKLLFAGVIRANDVPATFTARRLVVNIGVPQVVIVTVNGVGYAHSNGHSPETFVVESHDF